MYNKVFLKNLETNDGIALAKLAIMHECLEQYFQDSEVIESVIKRFSKIIQLGFSEIKPNQHNQLNHCLVNLYLEKLFANKVPSKDIIEESGNLTFPLFNYEKVLEDLKARIKKI